MTNTIPKSTDEYDLILTLKKTNTKTKGVALVKISKIKIVAKYLTGGLASVIEYLLDLFNEMIQTLPREEVAKYAQLAKDIANFIGNLADALIRNEARKIAAKLTAQAFADLATALLDSTLTREELDGVIAAAKAAIEAWNEAR